MYRGSTHLCRRQEGTSTFITENEGQRDLPSTAIYSSFHFFPAFPPNSKLGQEVPRALKINLRDVREATEHSIDIRGYVLPIIPGIVMIDMSIRHFSVEDIILTRDYKLSIISTESVLGSCR